MTVQARETSRQIHAAPMPKVSLIVAVYNKPEFLEKVLLSLLNQTMKDFEIVIADDGSGPLIAGVIKKYSGLFPLPISHVWHTDDGFRKTVIANKAVAAAAAEYLVFIDGDCVLHHRFLETHDRRRRPRTALAGRRVMLDREITGKLTNEDVASRRIERPAFWWRHCEKNDRKHGIYFPWLHGIENMLKKGYSFYGSNFSLFKEDFLAVNGYDEQIVGRGIEDDNLRQRLKLSGLGIRTVTREALQYHLFHTSKPVPHDAEAIRKFCFPQKAWAGDGVKKTGAGAGL